jgi:hypothetical protein
MEFRTMDKVQKRSDSERYAPSPEPFKTQWTEFSRHQTLTVRFQEPPPLLPKWTKPTNYMTRFLEGLRYYAASRKVAGSNPDEVIELVFNWSTLSSHIMSLVST